ncbi:MAG: hypothetical protein JO100_08200 [Pseudonocardia sp.]|nr:hypothetical protein [Pseudonocardia sp.]
MPGSPPEELDPALAALVLRQDPYPTYVTGRRWDVLVAYRSARVLFTDWRGPAFSAVGSRRVPVRGSSSARYGGASRADGPALP